MLNKTTFLSLNIEYFMKPLSMRSVSVKTDDWHWGQIIDLNVTIKLHSLWLLKTEICRWDSIQIQEKVRMSVSPNVSLTAPKLPTTEASADSKPWKWAYWYKTLPEDLTLSMDCNPVHFCVDRLMFYNQRQKSMSTSTNNWG